MILVERLWLGGFTFVSSRAYVAYRCFAICVFQPFLGVANATLAKVHRDRLAAAPGIETSRREAHLRATSDLQKEVGDDKRDRGDENGEDENGDDESGGMTRAETTLVALVWQLRFMTGTKRTTGYQKL